MVGLEQLLTQMFIEKVERYTMGKSSSLKAEKAEQLLRSMEFTLKVGQETAKVMNQLAPTVDAEVLKQYYRLGEKRLKNAYSYSKQLHSYLMETILALEVLAYQDTITKAIPAFIKRYDVSFNAQDTCCDIDYPLAADDQTLLGAIYMENYLKSLVLENEFCRLFEIETLTTLLQAAQREKLFNAREDLYNIFELVHQQALHCGLLEGLEGRLELTEQQKELLLYRVRLMDDPQVKLVLKSVQNNWIDLLEEKVLHRSIDDFERAYFERALMRYENRLKNWTQQGGPAGDFVVTQVKEVLDYKTQLTGVPMADELWRELYQKLQLTDGFEAKWTLVQTSISSPEDLADLIRAGVFEQKELEQINQRLSAREKLMIDAYLA